jgi:hypothetical protein
MAYKLEKGKSISHKGVTIEAHDDGLIISILGWQDLNLPEDTAMTLHDLLPQVFNWDDSKDQGK